MTTDKRKGLRLVAEARLQRYEKRVERAIVTALRSRERGVLQSLTAAGEFNEDNWPNQLSAQLRPTLDKMMRDVRDEISDKLGATSTRTIDIEGQLDRMIGKMEGLGPETARALENELSRGIAQGDSLSDMRKRITGVFDKAERAAASIARTETGIAVSSFGYESALALHQSGTPLWHSWLATDDSRTRPTHNEADDQTVPIDQPFTVGGASMMHPHDPAGPAKEVVNCRCSETYQTVPPTNVEG